MTDPIKLARECGILVSENSQQPGLNADKLRQYTARVRAEALEEAAKVCDEQALEPECPERAEYCAQAIRALIPEGGK